MNKTLLLIILWLPLSVDADIYQWTDENGKVHFSDKPPPNKQVQNITAETEKVNIDSSTREREKVGDIFAPPTPEELRYQEQQAAGRAQAQEAKKQRCDELRKELSFFKNERFYWVDKEGNESNASEDERREIISKLEQAIKDNC